MNTKKDSHSHHPPDLLKERQAFFFDGIRYSLGMTKVANNRLQEALYSLTTKDWEKEYLAVFTASVMLDAWSIIDSVHRLRNLIMQAPGIKQKSPELRIFYDKTEGVEALRNTIQHLRNEAKGFIDKNFPALGILTWVVLYKPNDESASLYSLVAGTIYPNFVYPIVNPLGKRIQPPVDQVTIILGNHSLCLSDVIEQVERVKLWIEQMSGKHLEAEPALVIRANLTFGKKGSAQAPSDYNKTVELKPDYPEALNNSGLTYAKLGKYDEALADYNKALELKPDYIDVLNNRGNVYLLLKRYDDALADYKLALELKPDYTPVLYNLAILFAVQGKADDSIYHLEKAINKDKKLQKIAKIEKDFDNLRKDPRFKKLIEPD